jgi:hypothetical protein
VGVDLEGARTVHSRNPNSDSLIHYQYSRKPTFEDVSDRLISGVPSEWVHHYFHLLCSDSVSFVQSWLFSFSIVCPFPQIALYDTQSNML